MILIFGRWGDRGFLRGWVLVVGSGVAAFWVGLMSCSFSYLLFEYFGLGWSEGRSWRLGLLVIWFGVCSYREEGSGGDVSRDGRREFRLFFAVGGWSFGDAGGEGGRFI